MKRHRLAFAAIASCILSLLLTGCWLTPKTSALKEVHRSYEADFVRLVLPAPEEKAPPPTNQPPFATTLDGIRRFRVKYGEDSAEAAHLKVLEGMIYLQSGRPSMALLISDDVKKASAKLTSATGQMVRDRLFADNFRSLADGWDEIHQYEDGNDGTVAEWRKLVSSADDIDARLRALPKKQLANPETDEGAIYLANSAAIFYVWAYELKFEEDKTEAEKADTQLKKVEWFKKGRDLIGLYLSPTEKTAAADASALPASAGRIRYLEWYNWLGKELQ